MRTTIRILAFMSACMNGIQWYVPYALSAEPALPARVHPFHVELIEKPTYTPIELIDSSGIFGLLRSDGFTISVIDSRLAADSQRRISVSSQSASPLGLCKWTIAGNQLISVNGAHVRQLSWPEMREERKWTLPKAKMQSDPIVTCIELSSSGKLIAVGCVGRLYVITTDNAAPRLVSQYTGYPTDIAFSPDDSRIAYAGPMSPPLVVRDTHSGGPVYPTEMQDDRLILSPHSPELARTAFYSVAYSNKANVFGACGASDAHAVGELYLWNCKDQVCTNTMKHKGSVFRHMIFDDESVVYVASSDELSTMTGSIFAIEPSSGRHKRSFVGIERAFFGMAVARESRVLAAASDTGKLYLWKMD